MAQMTPAQARVQDPILSSHARGYTHPERVGHHLFPVVDIPVRGMQIIKFGRESFRLYNARRAPGAATKRVQYGYASDPVSLVQDALEGLVPFELMDEASKVPGINLGQVATDNVMDTMTLLLESEQAGIATAPANYDVNHKVALDDTTQWDQDSVNIAKQMEPYKEAIRASVGRYPNTLILGAQVFSKAKHNAGVKEQFKYTGRESINLQMLANYLDIPNVQVGTAVALPDDATDATPFTDVWGNNAVLAYVPPGARNYGVPSYGYTYRLMGHPVVEVPYQDRNAKSWVYPTTFERRPYLVGMSAGFLIQNVVG